jgi:ribonuclease D
MLQRTAVAGAIAALTLAPAGCGGSGKNTESTTAPPTTASSAASHAAYADGVCGALATWKSALSSVGAKFQNPSALTKANLQAAAKTVTDATTTLQSDVQALGPPPKDAGPKAKAAVQNLKTELKSSANEIQTATENLSSAAGVLQAVNAASAALLKMSADISATITTLESLKASQSWRKAFANSPTCQSLSKS